MPKGAHAAPCLLRCLPLWETGVTRAQPHRSVGWVNPVMEAQSVPSKKVIFLFNYPRYTLVNLRTRIQVGLV